MQKIKILIADDNRDFRTRVRDYLLTIPEMNIVGEVDDGDQVLHTAEKLNPDVVLMDVSMPGMNGIDAARQLTGVIPGSKVIMLSVYNIDEYKTSALENGACDYVVKKDLATELLPAIQKAMNGNT